MQYLFSHSCRAVLERLSQERTLCVFDFDGTLAPIVDDPDDAVLGESTRQLLVHLSVLYPCVILSGRARPDLLTKLHGIDVAQAIGNHGAETSESTGAAVDRVQAWKAVMEQQLDSLAGVWVEDKGYSLAVHYRQYPRKVEVRRRILDAAQELDNVRVVGGKQVINLLAAEAANKGQALLAERERLACLWALYVGDDENDEDAFALKQNVVSVRIGRKLASHADYYLRRQEEIDNVLSRLIDLRVTSRKP